MIVPKECQQLEEFLQLLRNTCTQINNNWETLNPFNLTPEFDFSQLARYRTTILAWQETAFQDETIMMDLLSINKGGDIFLNYTHYLLERGIIGSVAVDPKTGSIHPIAQAVWRTSNADYYLSSSEGPLPDNQEETGPLFIDRNLHYFTSALNSLPKRSSGGRPKLDWEEFLIEVIRIANSPDGLPDTQAELERIMHAWCEKEWTGAGETTVRDMVRRIYRTLGHRAKT